MVGVLSVVGLFGGEVVPVSGFTYARVGARPSFVEFLQDFVDVTTVELILGFGGKRPRDL